LGQLCSPDERQLVHEDERLVRGKGDAVRESEAFQQDSRLVGRRVVLEESPLVLRLGKGEDELPARRGGSLLVQCFFFVNILSVWPSELLFSFQSPLVNPWTAKEE
jgi:hypothetical protein